MNAFEYRDQADEAEDYYNHPLRARNRDLEAENLALKRLLRENGITWPSPYAFVQQQRAPMRSTRSSMSSSLPHLPIEIVLKILEYSLTSKSPIIDPLCKLKNEHITTEEAKKDNQIAIHFLAACRACHTEGTRYLWSKNRFLFTTVQAVKTFAEVDFRYREMVREVGFRIIARFYDDEHSRVHKISRNSNRSSMQAKQFKLRVAKRAKEPTLARRGFRSYAWLQVVDFLEALLPPHDPNHDNALPRKRLLPNLEQLRMDLINFSEDVWQFPTAQLHDVASHHLGCSLNQVTVTGLPRDDVGIRAVHDLQGLLRDDGLWIDHDATFVLGSRGHLRPLPSDHMHLRVVRAMRPETGVKHHHHDDHPGFFDDFPPAPVDVGDTPISEFASCRTIWKKIPSKINKPEETKWVLFDRVSGLPWDQVENEILMDDDYLLMDEDHDDDEGLEAALMCENCGELHPGPIRAEMMDDLYDDF
ncbi:U4/U6.U5 snRNP associated protein [Pestalotiopsis sp. IQ-011]